MAGLNKIFSFTRSVRHGANVTDVKCDPGGGGNVTPIHSSAPGDDSFPLLTDIMVTVPTKGEGKEASVGYLDPVNTPVAQSGEKRIYSRDAGGAVIAEIYLKNDGTIVSENDSISSTLNADGSAEIDNGIGSVTIDAVGVVASTSGIGSLTQSPDGSAILTNGLGTLSMLVDGSVNINGLIITPLGVMISAAGKNSDTHTHPQAVDSNGDTQANTGAPL